MFIKVIVIELGSILVQFSSQDKMKHNLLQNNYDKHTQMFIDGDIDYTFYQAIEREFLKRYELFTINLN